jgi:tetratricopeptide (TPR) repeat protein
LQIIYADRDGKSERLEPIQVPGRYICKGSRSETRRRLEPTAPLEPRPLIFFIPNTVRLINLANEALSRNRIEEAASYIKRAETIGETTTEFLFYSAVVLFRKGEYESAIEKLQKAISPGSSDEYVSRFLEELVRRYGD